MPPTLDVIHTYPGFFGAESRCRIRIYRPPGFPPVVLASELPENPGTSITNLVEQLAAEVLGRYLDERRGYLRPLIWVEHYPPRAEGARDETWDLVTFPDYQPFQALEAGRWRVRFGEPDWRRLSRGQVERLIGEPLPPDA
jgi:hypothetical protein